MANNATHTPSLYLIPMFDLLLSLSSSLFVLGKKDKQKKTKNSRIFFLQATNSLDSLISPSDHLWSPFPFPLPTSQLSLCSALVLPVLKPIGGRDHSQTPPPSQKVGAGGRRKAAGGSGIAADRRLLWFRQEKKRHSV